MAEFTGATIAVTGLAAIGLSPHTDPGVVIAAFAGSVIFVISATEYSRFIRTALFAASWIAGIICADMTAAFITRATRGFITANPAVGALLASALVVRCLMAVDVDTVKGWIGRRRGNNE
ncbi:putative holin [Pseudocitrobacter faecalis]|uniref:putative holin n=1 Tax=Pseudocitrobacter faecalis TaxID=1398493 RepID=UPI003BA0D960